MQNNKMKILIVDDNPANIVSIEALLQGEDLELYKANSGNEALSMLLEHDFILVLLDVMMPGMDGLEVAEIMKSRERTRNIPIIFVTAMDRDEQVIFKAYETGAIDFLYKPINPIILRSKVKIFCDLYNKNIQLNKSLADKDFLIKEIHHRVKNNLFMVNSFIRLQQNRVKTEDESGLLDEIRSRISAILLIHDKLYKGSDYQNVEIDEYLSDIIGNLIETLSTSGQVTFKLDYEKIIIPVDTAIPLGLITTEMTTNTMKYAFPGDVSGEIESSISLDQTDQSLIFIFKDSGQGFSKEVTFENSSSLGMTLIYSLTEQLGGTIELDTSNGAKYKLVLPLG